MSAPILQVACAIICDPQGRILAAQRGPDMPHPGMWEFPGGKLEPGEDPRACIIREILEETGLHIIPQRQGPPTESSRPDGRTLHLIPFLCTITQGQAQAREHAQLCWYTPQELPTLHWLAPDLPIVEWVLQGMP